MEKEKDVHLKFHVFVIGLGFVLAGIIFGYLIYGRSPDEAYLAAIPVGIGVIAILNWNNKWVMVINNHEFMYSNTFGIKRTYKFSDIKKAERHINAGGIFHSYVTIHVNNEIIHIDGNAKVSKRFLDKLNTISELTTKG